MARTCIDWEPDDSHPFAPQPRILHVTKVPPSNSGVARHAAPLDRAFDRIGTRTTFGLSLEAHETQRISVVIGLARRVLYQLRRRHTELVVVDLSGRALAEFFAACLVAVTPPKRRPILWLVAHDAPELVGSPMLFSFLDRKGGRRVGMALSRSVGRALERWLVGRADALLALSELGAEALRGRFGHARVWSVPLPSELLTPAVKEPVIYCPAGVSVTALGPTLQAFESGRVSPDVRLRVGNLRLEDRRRVGLWFRSRGVGARVEFTGFLDQDALDESFATATVVVRHHPTSERTANWAAASGPLVSALAAGCAVLSTDPRGSRRCVELAGRDLAGAPERLPDEIVRTMADPSVVGELAARAIDHIRSTHVPEAVARYLASIWRDTYDRRAELPVIENLVGPESVSQHGLGGSLLLPSRLPDH